ncbi:SPOR domain-containing protein [Denitratimonas tolerans]|uniref:SPOR domain-containing protein n=1 Tax=Denitratimonas tolerans TaxID=1338420 RepID=A0AAW9R0P8_9GAMM|nr:SPOR domain-containing protein [Xanthomonadaceae bacterium]
MLTRSLIAILLVMNLVVAAWLWLRPVPLQVQAEPQAPASNAPTLVLLSEEEDPAPAGDLRLAEPDGPPEPTPGLDRLVCLEIGPFLTQADLRRAMNAFTPSAERLQFRETRALASRGYWVYLPAQGSRDAALATARELSAKGLRDYYVVAAGERENTISLGLFREMNNARQRHEQVRALGFDAQLQTRSDEIPNYWIDLMVDKEFDWQSRVAGYPGVTAATVACR